ncbi:hypothetical protein M2277_005147 [Paenibacillus sp. LBL]|nr:hypothetical protein [Paenibacillus sp. LBL]
MGTEWEVNNIVRELKIIGEHLLNDLYTKAMCVEVYLLHLLRRI